MTVEDRMKGTILSVGPYPIGCAQKPLDHYFSAFFFSWDKNKQAGIIVQCMNTQIEKATK